MAANKKAKLGRDVRWTEVPRSPRRSAKAEEPVAYECWRQDGVHVLKGTRPA